MLESDIVRSAENCIWSGRGELHLGSRDWVKAKGASPSVDEFAPFVQGRMAGTDEDEPVRVLPGESLDDLAVLARYWVLFEDIPVGENDSLQELKVGDGFLLRVIEVLKHCHDVPLIDCSAHLPFERCGAEVEWEGLREKSELISWQRLRGFWFAPGHGVGRSNVPISRGLSKFAVNRYSGAFAG